MPEKERFAKIVLIGGPISHGPGEHDFNHGIELFKTFLTMSPEAKAIKDLSIEAHPYGWPDKAALEGAATLVATNLNQETAGYIQGHEAYKGDDLIETNPNPEAYRDARSFRLYSRLEKRLSDTHTFVLTPYLRKTDMDFLQHFLPQTPLEENGQESVGFQFTWYADSTEAFQWIVGLDAELTDGYLRESQYGPTVGPFPTGLHYDYQVNALQVAPFVQLNWVLAQRWHFSAGLRFETMRYDYNNKMIAGNTQADGAPCATPTGCRYSRPADREDSFHNASPQLGLMYQLSDNHRLFANIANGFRAPQATELYRLQNNQQLADLASEKVLSYELGAQGDAAAFSYQVSLYAMRKENIIFRDTALGNNRGDGETEHRGMEIGLRYPLAEHWEFGLVANYANHQYANQQSLSTENIQGNQEDAAPRHFGTAHLGWQITPSARAELEWVHMGSYDTDPENRHRYGGHDLLNLRTQWAFHKKLRFKLNILNLIDRPYADRADWTVFGGDRYFPGEPRSVYVGVIFYL